MSSKLDMTLDQLVKMDKSSSSGNKRNLRPKRSNPIQRPRANQAPRRDLQTRSNRSGNSSGAEASAKINISNLNNNVTSNDLRDIFSKVGPIRSANINFRENGTSAGTGSVIFKLSGDALTAFKRYHNVKLDGRPMRIEVAFIPSEQSGAPQASTSSAPQTSSRPPRRNGPSNRRGGPRPGNVRKGGRTAPKSAEQLDKELQGYMNTGGDDNTMIVED